jgi:BlaI family penicillinase repressor
MLESSQTCYKNNTAKNDTAESNMSPTAAHTSLTKRERLIMDALYQLGRATAAEVLARLPGSPSSSTVRTQLRVLEAKGHVRHEEEGLRFIYMPTVPRHAARRSALRHLVDTFFEGSSARVVAALLGGEGSTVSDEELARIEDLVRSARKPAARRTATRKADQ